MCRRSPRPRPAARQLTALTFAIGDPSRRWSGTCPRATRRSTRLRGKEEFGETRARTRARTHAGTQARRHARAKARHIDACAHARAKLPGAAVSGVLADKAQWTQTRQSQWSGSKRGAVEGTRSRTLRRSVANRGVAAEGSTSLLSAANVPLPTGRRRKEHVACTRHGREGLRQGRDVETRARGRGHAPGT